MRLLCSSVCVLFSIILNYHLTFGQVPPRLNIPGAVLVGQAKPAPFRHPARIHGDGPPPRLRRPIPNAAPAPVRPVVEEPEETPSSTANNFDDEVSKLGISALQSAVRQAAEDEDASPRPVQFRPERPVPVLRADIRENLPVQRPAPILRQEQRENIPRPLLRQEPRDDAPLPVRQPQPVRHSQPRQQAPVEPPQRAFRQQARVSPSPPPRQPSQYLDEQGGGRQGRRKPPVQILRKYRTDNEDGSITWGFENEDGTFKEEILGNDCITRGKYGYIDPDGVRREYNYETGNKCDDPDEEELILQEKAQQQQQPQPQPRKPQFRPPPAQY